MVSCRTGVSAAAVLTAAAIFAMPVAALTTRECGIAYKKAKRSGTLGGMSWQAFRKARCGPSAPAAGLPPGGSAYLPGGRAVFPTAISPKYRDETPLRGRRLTCLDQYRLNKASNLNGGLRWVQKGGGYHSECNKRLRTSPPSRSGAPRGKP